MLSVQAKWRIKSYVDVYALLFKKYDFFGLNKNQYVSKMLFSHQHSPLLLYTYKHSSRLFEKETF